MDQRLMNATDLPERSVPTRIGTLVFETKATLLRTRRAWADLVGSSPKRHRVESSLRDAPILATVRSPLWTTTGGAKDRALNAGKIQNLRVAVSELDGIEVGAGDVLSFWRQVGRPRRRRGFVEGRELREGCMIATVGGGLCQLSNALHEAAIDAGLETVERHAHTRIVPGSRAEAGRDATVFWNYLDLRVRAPRPFRIDATLSADELTLTIRGERDAAAIASPDFLAGVAAHDCLSCGQLSCHRHNPDTGPGEASTAWLVDLPSPGFVALYRDRARDADRLMLPSRRFGRHADGWPAIADEVTADLAALRRTIALRTASPAVPRASVLLAGDAMLAASYAHKLSARHTHLIVAQSLLPHLWRLGVLRGRSFDVWLDRLPMSALHATLDAAARRYPDSHTLRDFRAPSEIVAAERDALAAARQLISPHRAVAANFPQDRVTLIDWPAARPLPAKLGGKTFLFAGPALARKGIHAMREAMVGLDITLLIERRAVETAEFWGTLDVRQLESPPGELAGIVLPALVEHDPHTLLRALAAGLPVIATPACGLPAQAGLTMIPADDPVALRAAIGAIIAIK